MSENRYRAAEARLVMAEPMPFGQRYEYHDEIAIQAMLEAEFFLPLARRFRTGDHLVLVALQPGGRRVAEEQAFRVIEAGPGTFDIQPCGERYTYLGGPDTATESQKTAPKRPASVRKAGRERTGAAA